MFLFLLLFILTSTSINVKRTVWCQRVTFNPASLFCWDIFFLCFTRYLYILYNVEIRYCSRKQSVRGRVNIFFCKLLKYQISFYVSYVCIDIHTYIWFYFWLRKSIIRLGNTFSNIYTLTNKMQIVVWMAKSAMVRVSPATNSLFSRYVFNNSHDFSTACTSSSFRECAPCNATGY